MTNTKNWTSTTAVDQYQCYRRLVSFGRALISTVTLPFLTTAGLLVMACAARAYSRRKPLHCFDHHQHRR